MPEKKLEKKTFDELSEINQTRIIETLIEFANQQVGFSREEIVQNYITKYIRNHNLRMTPAEWESWEVTTASLFKHLSKDE